MQLGGVTIRHCVDDTISALGELSRLAEGKQPSSQTGSTLPLEEISVLEKLARDVFIRMSKQVAQLSGQVYDPLRVERVGMLGRLHQVYCSGLDRLKDEYDTGEIVQEFFKALDDSFKVDTQKLEAETLVGYLERKILNPIEDLLKSNDFSNDQDLRKTRNFYTLVRAGLDGL